MRNLTLFTVACVLGLATQLRAQFPNGSAEPVPAETPVSANPIDGMWVESWGGGGPQYWARGEYVLWAIGTGKLVEMGKESYNSAELNALLAAAGKDYRDFARWLLGNDRRGFRISAGAWADDTQHIGVELGFLWVDRPPLTLNLLRGDRAPLERLIDNNAPELQRPDRPLLALLLLRRMGVPVLDVLRRLVIVSFFDRN